MTSNFLQQLIGRGDYGNEENTENNAPTRSIYVPTTYNNYVEIQIDNLPDPNNIKTLIAFLQKNKATVKLWHRIALEYRKAGHLKAFEKLIDTASEPDLTTREWKEEECLYNGDTASRVALLNCRGCMYINSLQNEEKKSSRDSAATCFMLADKIAVSKPTNIFSSAQYDTSTWVGKALHSFKQSYHQDNTEKGANDLKKALQQEKHHVPALLAKGCMSFHKKKYEDALIAYRMALEANSKAGPAQPEIYLGIGVCCMKLKDATLAKKAFERCLAVNPEGPVSIRARAGLVMLLYCRMDEDSVKDAMKYLIEAHGFSPSDPVTLVLLGHVFFWKGQYSIARKSAGVALSNTNNFNKSLRAECAYLLGKTYHAESDYDNATKYYEEAVKLDKDNFMALFGLAQMRIYNNNNPEALTYLQKIANRYPENMILLKLMGDLYYNQGQETESKKTLEKFVLLQPSDVNAWIRLAQVCELTDFTAALNAYRKAVDLMKQQTMKIPFEIFNNIAGLHFQLGDNDQALKWCEELIQSFVEEEYRIDLTRRKQRTRPLKSNAVTVYYNYGIYLEKQGRMSDAIYLYQEIIADYPDDIDCTLRIGMILSALGDDKGALNIYDKAITRCLDSNQTDLNARSLKTRCCLNMGDFKTANRELANIYKKNPKDVYNIVALGNYNLMVRKPGDNDKLQEAAKWFFEALRIDAHNVYAANGMAVCLAELNLLTEAKLILEQLREVSNLADVWINLGNIFVKKEVYPAAIKKYETVMRDVSDSDYSEIAMYLAKVFFEVEDRKGAKKLLSSILHRDPTNEQAWYSLSIVQETNAFQVLTKKHSKRTMDEVQEAMEDLKQAKKTFERLAETGNPARAKKCRKHAGWCEQTIRNGEQHLKYHQTQSQKLQKKRMEERQMVNVWIQQEKAKEAARIAEEKRIKEEQERQAQEQRKKADAMALEIANNKRLLQNKKEERKRKKDAVTAAETGIEFDGEIGEVVGSVEIDLEPEQQPPPKPKKKKKKKKKRKLTDRGEGPEAEEVPKKKKKLDVDFETRADWTELQHTLYSRIDTIIREGDHAQLSKRSIRKKLQEENPEVSMQELKPFLNACVAHIVQNMGT